MKDVFRRAALRSLNPQGGEETCRVQSRVSEASRRNRGAVSVSTPIPGYRAESRRYYDEAYTGVRRLVLDPDSRQLMSLLCALRNQLSVVVAVVGWHVRWHGVGVPVGTASFPWFLEPPCCTQT